MSLSRILTGPELTDSLMSPGRTPVARDSDEDWNIFTPSTPDSSEILTVVDTPNPFILTTQPNTPASDTTIRYASFFGDGQGQSSPTLDSPTPQYSGRTRALRRHHAIALIVPVTPSTPTFPDATLHDDIDSEPTVEDALSDGAQDEGMDFEPTVRDALSNGTQVFFCSELLNFTKLARSPPFLS